MPKYLVMSGLGLLLKGKYGDAGPERADTQKRALRIAKRHGIRDGDGLTVTCCLVPEWLGGPYWRINKAGPPVREPGKPF